MPVTRRGSQRIDMNNGRLLAAGIVGSVIAAICRATPIVAKILDVLGLSAWRTQVDYVMIPIFLICLGMVVFALYRRIGAWACCDPAPSRTNGPRN
jgi:mercuric ion transport protein